MTTYDFNQATEQRSIELIPAGTTLAVQLNVRPGGGGDDGFLKPSKNGQSRGLDCEFVVIDGDYAKRKFWTLFTLDGETEGHKEAGAISASRLRAILESARGVRPDDHSEAAQEARRIQSYGDLDGLRFIAKVGVEAATGGYAAKNTLADVITPNRRDWRRLEQIPVERGAGAPASSSPSAKTKKAKSAAPAIQKPAWA